MKGLLKQIISFTFAILLTNTQLLAQEKNNPAKWSYEVKKITQNEFELIFNLKLDKGFHIWALKPGGDGFQIVPSFNFEKKSTLKMIGPIIEKGKLVTLNMEGVDGPVSYLSDDVQYIQRIKVTNETIIKGEHEYQICNDVMCLPPTTQSFSFIIN
jgi:thiol:disulfide interchange protein DsbD